MTEALLRNMTSRFTSTPAVIAPAGHMHAVPARIPIFAHQKRNYRREHLVTKAVESATLLPAIPDTSRSELKAQLLDSLFGTDRGLRASSELRAELNEIITQLEAKNPNPSLETASAVLDGQWKLVYTSNSELVALLALNRLPFVSVGDITQTIDSATLSAVNTVSLTVPFSRTSLSTQASFEIRSPKRLQVKFEKGSVATPELLQDIELPSSITVLGQPVDLSPLKAALQPVESIAQGAVRQLAALLAQQPDLQFPISSRQAQTWLINTYLDEDTRITRGDVGSVFVLVKDVSLQQPTTAIAAAQLNAEAAVSADFEE